MKAQALKPSFLTMPSMNKEKDGEGKLSDEEQALGALSETGGWVVLRNFIENLKSDLDNMNAASIASGASFEEIGKNTVVVNMSKEVIKRILSKVSDAKEAYEKVNE